MFWTALFLGNFPSNIAIRSVFYSRVSLVTSTDFSLRYLFQKHVNNLLRENEVLKVFWTAFSFNKMSASIWIGCFFDFCQYSGQRFLSVVFFGPKLLIVPFCRKLFARGSANIFEANISMTSIFDINNFTLFRAAFSYDNLTASLSIRFISWSEGLTAVFLYCSFSTSNWIRSFSSSFFWHCFGVQFPAVFFC